jgi:hypothetical protein
LSITQDLHWWIWYDDGSGRVLDFGTVPERVMVHSVLKAVKSLGVPDAEQKINNLEEAGEKAYLYVWDPERDEWKWDQEGVSLK